MADTEFEELDKAVASVLGPVATDDAPATSRIEVEGTTPALVIPERVQETPSPTVAPRTRPAGGTRFMDVVPPSMIARPGQTAKPTPEPTPAAEQPATPTFEQPDPLDFQGFKMDETPTPIEPTPPTPEETPTEPLNSPFLNDAKVEKRPLGAFSDTPKPAEEPAVVEPKSPEELAEKDATIPEELHPDLLSIESDEVTPQEIPPTPSIVQQYQEKPNSDTQPSAAIYDAEAHHMPLVHAAKKRSSWLIVVWIVALLLVGGGIGAMLYFVVLPMLG